jgi:hypothetical protein
MSQVIYNLSEISPDNITFGPLKTLDIGGKMIGFYHNKKPLIFATPPCNIPFGITDWENTKFSINMTLADDDGLLKTIKEIEQKIIAEAVANSKVWFKKQMSADVMEELFTSSIKYSKDKNTGENSKYRPTLKVTLPYKNGQFDCQAYNNKKESIQISKETIPKGSTLEGILSYSTIWFTGGNKFVGSLKFMQLKVTPGKSDAKYAFIDDEDDVINEVE